jgi:dTDP-4-amino-4,6-dideoxygalactose transaminase
VKATTTMARLLRLGLAGLGIGRGDEMILPANTYIATALAVSDVGATPVLVDCDSGTYEIDPAAVEDALTARTRAVIAVHLCGQAAPMERLQIEHVVTTIRDFFGDHGRP